MNTTRNCGCKGYRTCLICESEYQIEEKVNSVKLQDKEVFVYCPWCDKAWQNTDANSYKDHPNHSGYSRSFPGIFIKTDFISKDEENEIMKGIDEMPWDLSQSGRRKQNFGPKTNFKKMKLRPGNFKGFPLFSKFIQEKFQTVTLLKNYHTIEQCSLEYDPNRGASIDPHIDDCWIWGERILTVNCLSDSILTLTPYKGHKNKYNLSQRSNYNRIVNCKGELKEDEEMIIENHQEELLENVVIKIPMPRRSLIVMYGSARYDWEHSVLREDIKERRVCIAYREFTPPYLPGGNKENLGSEILNIAKLFWNHHSVENVG